MAATDRWVATTYTYWDKWGTWEYVTKLSVGEGESRKNITLPITADNSGRIDDVSGPVVSDGRFYIGAGGNAGERAGVYEIKDDGTTVRVLRPPHRGGKFVDLALGEKRLIYAQAVEGAAADGETEVFVKDLKRPAADGALVEVSAQRKLPFRLRRPGPSSALSMSGDQLLARRSQDGQDYFGTSNLDYETAYGRRRGDAPDGDAPIQQSGPYSLAGGRLFRQDLSRVLLNVATHNAALFGPRVIWRTAAGEVLTQEVFGEKEPRVLVKSGAVGPVALYGTRYAWLTASGRIGVRELTGGVIRSVKAEAGARDVRLQENTLSWTADDGTVQLLDLGNTQASPTPSELSVPYAVSGDLIAGLDVSGAIRVQKLPYSAGTSKPRLVAATGRGAVPPRTEWLTNLYLSSSAQNLTLRIRHQGRTIRTLRSTDAGDEVGFSWDGRTGAKAWAKPGRYEWVLSGVGVNGGAVTDTDGRSPASGTLTVKSGTS